MQKSFDSRLADFSGISGSNNLYINEVIFKKKIQHS